jgi:DNA-directed RNA polymerase specialized sigma24 family protein
LSARRRSERTALADEALLLNLEDASPGLEERLETAERHGTVLRLLEELPERCRELLRALFLDPDEPSYDHITERFGLPRGSIGPTRSRCLHLLHESLRELDRRAPGGESQKSASRPRISIGSGCTAEPVAPETLAGMVPAGGLEQV